MEIFSTSQDLLNLVKAIAVFSLSFFVCWLLFYMVMVFRQLFKTVKEIRQRVEDIGEIVVLFKKKLQTGNSYLLLLNEIIDKVSKRVKAKKAKTKKRKAKKE